MAETILEQIKHQVERLA